MIYKTIGKIKLFKFSSFNIGNKLVYILLLLVLVFGRDFTKLELINPLHAYDFLLLSIAFFLFSKNKKSINIYDNNVGIILLISILYVLFSFFQGRMSSYIVRQYALFGYMFVGYFLSVFLFNSSRRQFLNIIIKISILSFYIQTFYVIYLLLTGDNVLLSSDEKSYYSPLIILGLITFHSYILVYYKPIVPKICYLLVNFLLMYSSGHASAFLAVLFLSFVYLLITHKGLFRVIFLMFAIAFLFFLFLSNKEFSDNNASWRLLFWKHAWETIAHKNFLLLGEGFGVEYADEKLMNTIQSQLGKDHLENDNNAFLIPMHNSFLTIFFHIGLIPGLLIFLPFLVLLVRKRSRLYKDPVKFLLLNVVGLIIWCSFNVILELPHSSLYFWLNYYLLLFTLKIKNERRVLSRKPFLSHSAPSAC